MTLVGHMRPELNQGTEATASVGESDTLDGTELQRNMGDLNQNIVKNN